MIFKNTFILIWAGILVAGGTCFIQGDWWGFLGFLIFSMNVLLLAIVYWLEENDKLGAFVTPEDYEFIRDDAEAIRSDFENVINLRTPNDHPRQ